ncbi:hypothetical protein FGB62_6g016 [Gracilaria domingensis]|nr:hypothetical protein FGB62_6g016 [Gracilaria domingensis]
MLVDWSANEVRCLAVAERAIWIREEEHADRIRMKSMQVLARRGAGGKLWLMRVQVGEVGELWDPRDADQVLTCSVRLDWLSTTRVSRIPHASVTLTLATAGATTHRARVCFELYLRPYTDTEKTQQLSADSATHSSFSKRPTHLLTFQSSEPGLREDGEIDSSD